jgi:hypothetical protein
MTSPSEPATSTSGLDPAGPPILAEPGPGTLEPEPPGLTQPDATGLAPVDLATGPPPVDPATGPPPVGPAVDPASGKRPGRVRRLMTLVLLIVVGIAGVAGGGFALAHEMTRKATKAEITAAAAKELASRWRRLPAGKIFPATVGYQDYGGNAVTAYLVGIAPPVSCPSAMNAAAFARIRPFGCSTMLRATYVDASGTLAVTVGVAVMSSGTAASNALARLGTMATGVSLDALSFRGTVTNDFGNAQRAAGATQMTGGPYLFLFSAGYADGVPASAAGSNPELVPLGSGLLSSLQSALTTMGNPCGMKDIHC